MQTKNPGDKYSIYIPDDRRQALALGRQLPDRSQGAALFSDVSGFTPLTEALVREFGSQRGAEELTRYLNLVFEALIGCLQRYSGSVISFAGDALTCWFDQDDGLRAVTCAMAMQQAMQQFSEVNVTSRAGSPGFRGKLTMKVAVATGTVRRFVVGDPDIQLIDALAGSTLYSLAATEHYANPGEVLLDPAATRALEGRVNLSGCRSGEENGKQYGVVASLVETAEELFFPTLPDGAFQEEQLRPWLLPPIYERLRQGKGEFLAELRPAQVFFLNFTGIDFDNDPDAGEKLDAFIRWVQNVLLRYDAYLFQIIIGDKGSYFYGAFGAPIAHEDDAVRAVSAALELSTPPAELGYIQQVKTGISQGRLRTGAYGSSERRTYGVLGDDVNLAARLMQAAQPGRVLTNKAVQHTTGSTFTWEELPPIRVKGKAEPVQVASPLSRQVQKTMRFMALQYALPIVGRTEELLLCDQKLELAANQHGQILGITSAPGLGKTRLVSEVILKGVMEHGMHPFGGECSSFATETSYLVWQPIWRGLFGLDPADSTLRQIETLQFELQKINPELLPRLPLLGTVVNLPIPHNELTKSLDAKLRKTSLEGLLVDCIRYFARKNNLLLVFEDCQWLDSLSHELLEVIGRAISDLPVLMVLAYRPVELQYLQAPRLSRLANFSEITLEELSSEETRQLIGLKLGQFSTHQEEVPELLVERIMTNAEGNPFYIEELLNYINDRGIDPYDPKALASLDLPNSVHTLILSRVDQLPENQQVRLKVASVIGRLFQANLLWGMYPELGDMQMVRSDLDALADMELTAQDPTEPELTYFFKQLVTQQVAYENLPYAMRKLLHESLANYIERNYVDSLHQYTNLLAFHYLRGEQWEKAIQYNLAAAQRARNEFANQSAILAGQHILEAAEQLPGKDTSKEQIQARDILGEVLSVVGRYEEALDHYTRALEQTGLQAESPEKSSQMVRFCRKIAEVYERRNEFSEASTWLKRGLSYIDPAAPTNEGARIYAFGAGLYQRQGNHTEAISWCEKSLAIASNKTDHYSQHTVAQVNYLLGNSYNRLGDLNNAITYCRKSIEIFEAIGEYMGLSKAYNNLGVIYRDKGDWEMSSQAYTKSLELNKKIGDIQQTGFGANNMGEIHQYRGELDQAAELYMQSNRIWKQLGAILFDAVTLSNLGQVHIYRNELDAARQALTESQELFRQSKADSFLSELERRWGELYLRTGQFTEALSHTRGSINLAVAQQDRLEEGKSLMVLGEVLLAQGQLEEARGVLKQSLSILEEIDSEYEAARARLVLAGLAFNTQDFEESRALLQKAQPVFEKIGARVELARLKALAGKLA